MLKKVSVALHATGTEKPTPASSPGVPVPWRGAACGRGAQTWASCR